MNRDVIIVLGKTGWGKSLWSKLYAKTYDRLLIYDPLIDYPFVEYKNVDDIYTDLLSYDYDLDVIKMFIKEFSHTPEFNKQKFRYGISDINQLDRLGNISFVIGNNLLLIEETSTVFQKGMRGLPEWASRLVFLGRHRRCNLLLIAQRSASIPIDFRSQASRIISFQQHESDDVGWLKDFYGKRVSEIPYLDKFECLDYCNGNISKYSIEKPIEKVFKIKLDKGISDMVYF